MILRNLKLLTMCVFSISMVLTMPLTAGTDDDLPPTYQPRGPRVIFNGNGSLPQPNLHSNVDREIRQIEQQAYTGVLRAFKVQSDAITWVISTMEILNCNCPLPTILL